MSNNHLVPKHIPVSRLKKGYLRSDVNDNIPDKRSLTQIDLQDIDLPDDSFEEEVPQSIGEAIVPTIDQNDVSLHDAHELWPETDKFEVEKVLKARMIDDKEDSLEYYVKFKQFDTSYNTWVPYTQLSLELQKEVTDNPPRMLRKSKPVWYKP